MERRPLRYIREVLEYIRNSHGPDAIAFYGSGQLDTETAYLAAKLFKGTFGTNNTDSNSRLCMAAAVAGYRTSLGSDGPPTCYDDIDHADVIFIIGSNMAEAHPVTFDRVRARESGTPGNEVDRRRPAAHADGPRGRHLSARGSRRRHRPAQRPGPAAA